MEERYSFKRLRYHTAYIKSKTQHSFVSKIDSLENAFSSFDKYFLELENKEKTLENNVRKILAVSFINHMYSALILVECGLIPGALICERKALEILAFEFVLRINPEYTNKYNKNKIPTAVEVRKELEKRGMVEESKKIRELYSPLSGVVHAGRDDNNLISNYLDKDSWELSVGGKHCVNETCHMLEVIPALIFWFTGKLSLNDFTDSNTVM
jgi:hypothetical protein